MINTSQFALSLALCATVLKLIWVWAIAISPRTMQAFFDWLASIHFVDPVIVIHPVDFWTAVLMVSLTFLVACAIGAMIATIFNLVAKQQN